MRLIDYKLGVAIASLVFILFLASPAQAQFKCIAPVASKMAGALFTTEKECKEKCITKTCESTKKGIKGALGLFQSVGQQAGFPEKAQDPEVVVGQIIKGAIVMIGAVFGVLVVYGGYLWMIARGNEEYIKKAKNILERAAIGLIIVMGAYAITAFIVERVIGAAY